jgi:hypothetical protein
MKRFKQYINEETNPTALTKNGVIDVNDSAVRDNINALLSGATSGKFVTPYIALERIGKVLANFHIFLPKYSFMEGDSGMAVFEVNQFGMKMGMTNDGRVITADDSNKYSIFFEYRMSDCGMFNVFCELVDEDELEDLLGEVEDELNDEGDDEEEEDDDEELNESNKENKDKKKEWIKKQGGKLKDARKKIKDNVNRFDMRNLKLAEEELDEGHQKSSFYKKVEQLDEISDKVKSGYTKAAEKDKSHAERQAAHSEYTAKHTQDPKKKEAFKNEADWLKSIVAKRARGLKLAKK